MATAINKISEIIKTQELTISQLNEKITGLEEQIKELTSVKQVPTMIMQIIHTKPYTVNWYIKDNEEDKTYTLINTNIYDAIKWFRTLDSYSEMTTLDSCDLSCGFNNSLVYSVPLGETSTIQRVNENILEDSLLQMYKKMIEMLLVTIDDDDFENRGKVYNHTEVGWKKEKTEDNPDIAEYRYNLS